MEMLAGGSVAGGSGSPHIIFSSNGFLYCEKSTSDSKIYIQCIRGSKCSAQGFIVDQEICLKSQHNHSHYTDRVVALKTRNDSNRKSARLELIKLVKVKSSSDSDNSNNQIQEAVENSDVHCNAGDLLRKGPLRDTKTCTSIKSVPDELLAPECDVQILASTQLGGSRSSSNEKSGGSLVSNSPLLTENTAEELHSELPEFGSPLTEEPEGTNLPEIECVKSERFDSPLPSQEIISTDVVNTEKTSLVSTCLEQAFGSYTDVNEDDGNEISIEEEDPDMQKTVVIVEEEDDEEEQEQEEEEQRKRREEVQGTAFPTSAPPARCWKPSKVELIEGAMKNSYLYLQEGFLYERNTVSKNDRIYMHCNQRRRHPFCHARGVMENGHIRVTREHNHLPDPIRVDKLKLKARCRRRAEEDANANLKEIFQEEAANFKASSFEFKYSFFGRMMKRRKRSVPDLPSSMDEFMQTLQDNELRLCTAQSGLQFFSSFITATDFSIATFISPAFNDLFKNVDTVYIDCMFKEVPFLFSHMCTMLICIEDYVFPVAYALMTSDTEASYAILFKYFKQQLPELTPRRFVLEYDYKVMNSVNAAYPSAECIGGLLSYSLAVWREVQEHSFIKSYTEDREAQLCLRMILALPLLPSRNVEEGFTVVHHKIQGLKQGGLVLEQVLGFVQECWLNRMGPDNFSVAGKPDRCSLDVDAYLGRLKYKVGNSSGNIWVTLDKLKQFEESERKELEKVLKKAPSKRKTSCILSHGKIKEVTEKLVNMKMSTKGFLEEVLVFVNPPTSDALEMYTKMYPVKLSPHFSPVVEIVTFNESVQSKCTL